MPVKEGQPRGNIIDFTSRSFRVLKGTLATQRIQKGNIIDFVSHSFRHLEGSLDKHGKRRWSRILFLATETFGLGREITDDSGNSIGYGITLAREVPHRQLQEAHRPTICFYPQENALEYQIDDGNKVRFSLGEETTVTIDTDSLRFQKTTNSANIELAIVKDGTAELRVSPLHEDDTYGFVRKEMTARTGYVYKDNAKTVRVDISGYSSQRLARGGKLIVSGASDTDAMRISVFVSAGEKFFYRAEPRRTPLRFPPHVPDQGERAEIAA